MKTVFNNLNWGEPDRHAERIEDMIERGAEVILVCEVVNTLSRVQYREYQPPEGKGSEAILVRKGIDILRRSSILSALDLRGQAIGWRRFVMVVLHVPKVGAVAFIVAHMPPKRMWDVLYAVYAWRLRRFVKTQCFAKGIRKVAIYADWNKDLYTDPASLKAKFGFKWYGNMRRIDGIAVSEALVPYVKNHYAQPHPNRTDGHPSWWMVIDD